MIPVLLAIGLAQDIQNVPWTPLPPLDSPTPDAAPPAPESPTGAPDAAPPAPATADPTDAPPDPAPSPDTPASTAPLTPTPAPPPRPEARPLDSCRPGQTATDGRYLVHSTPGGELRAWSLPDLRDHGGWHLEDASCTSLTPWRGAFVCTRARGRPLAWSDTWGMTWALPAELRDPTWALPSPSGDLIIEQPRTWALLVQDPDGPGPAPGVTMDLRGLGRDARSVSFDPTGALVASLDAGGTLWVGRWPGQAQFAGVDLQTTGRSADAPRRVFFSAPDAVVVQLGGGRWRRFVLVDPGLPVPLLLDELPPRSPETGATWLAPAGPTVTWQGTEGPASVLRGDGELDWAEGGGPVAGAAGWQGTLYAVRCDGTVTTHTGLQPGASTPNPGLSAVLAAGGLEQASRTWQAVATAALQDPARVDRLVRQIAVSLPIGDGGEGRGDGPVSAATFINEANEILDRAEAGGLWRAPLASAAAQLDQAAAMARDVEGLGPARQRLERLVVRKRELQLRVTLSSGVVLAASALLWRVLDRRRRARQRVIDAGHNPFRRDSPHDPARTPFAEHPLVEDVLRNLLQNCVVIEAPAFSGKSALLRHVAWRLEHEGLGGSPVRAAWVTLKDVPEERFWTAVGHALARAAIEFPDSAALLAEPNLDRFAVEVFLEELWAWEGEVDLPRRVVLVLDDIDVLGRYSHENQRLRGLLQVVPGHRLTLLGAARSIRVGWEHGGADSPWFNVFQVRELPPMRAEDSARYVRRRLGPPFSVHPYVPAALHRKSGGRPLYLWHLAYATVEEALLNQTTSVKPEHVFAAERAIRELIQLEASPLYEGEAAFEHALHSIAALRRRRDTLLTQLGGAPLGDGPPWGAPPRGAPEEGI